MQPQIADPSQALALALGVIAGEIALASAGSPPDWIKVTPRGQQQCRDGRSYLFDPEGLAERFAADGIDIPIDTDHSTVLRGNRGETPNTVGYATAVEARPDGLYAKPNWLDAGKAVLKAKTHRFVSPSVYPDDAGKTVWLHSIALVSAPALAMPALAHATPEPFMKQIAKALGLAETADEAACLAALGGRADVKSLAAALGLAEGADAAACLAAIGTLRQGQSGLVAELQTNLAATTARLAAVEKAARDKEVADLLEGALRAKKIVPAQRDSYVAMCATDHGLQNVRTLLAATPDGLQSSGLDARAAETGDAAQDPVALAAEARKYIADQAALGVTVGIGDAMTVVTSRKKS